MSEHHDKEHAYEMLTAGFNAGLMLFATRRVTQRRFAQGVPWQDVALLGVAAHKVSRILATDRVAQPLRSPVTEGEHKRKPSGDGMHRALGELVTCPYCLAPWLSLGLGAAYVAYPEPTRAASAVLSAATVSDFLNRAYHWLSSKR